MKLKDRILIVDDEPVNVEVLQRKLEKTGYEVRTATNGFECLDEVRKEAPDIILLDIMMPEMDGVETCRRLKADPKTATIPVIFVTAKMDKSDKISGLDHGAIDYITKPIDMEETMARVRTHLRLKMMHDENLELQQRLEEARRTAAVGSMTQGIAHNLNNLLGVVVGYLDLLKLRTSQPDKLENGIASMEKAVKRMVDLVRQLSLMATDEPVTSARAGIAQCVTNVIDRTTRKSESGAQTVTVKDNLPTDFEIHTSLETLESCFEHLIRNGIESYPEGTPADDRKVAVTLNLLREGADRQIEVLVQDEGTGIQPSISDRLFDPFVSTKNSVGRGFGLTVVKHSVSRLGGGVTIGPNGSEPGTCAVLRIPFDSE
ncbi:MAG: hybrid sensor histidine kinase/response regulator [Verrucomicrobiota bacterium]